MLWVDERNSTKRGTTPHSMTRSIGGFFSLESSLRNLVVASSWASGLSEKTACIICGRSESYKRGGMPAREGATSCQRGS
jgi:hypothetical protein